MTGKSDIVWIRLSRSLGHFLTLRQKQKKTHTVETLLLIASKTAQVVSSAGKMSWEFWVAKGIILIFKTAMLSMKSTISSYWDAYESISRQRFKETNERNFASPGKCTRTQVLGFNCCYNSGFPLVHCLPLLSIWPHLATIGSAAEYLFVQQDEISLTNGVRALIYRWKKCVNCMLNIKPHLVTFHERVLVGLRTF